MQEADNKAVVDRLAELMRETRARSVRAFALSFNADPSFYAKIHKGETDLTERIADEISKKYGVNKEWLFTGRGPKKADLDSEVYPSLTPEQVLGVLALAYKDQSAALRVQAGIMEDIRNNMARSDVQARMDANLTLVLAGVKSLAFVRDRLDRMMPPPGPEDLPVERSDRGADGRKKGVRNG